MQLLAETLQNISVKGVPEDYHHLASIRKLPIIVIDNVESYIRPRSKDKSFWKPILSGALAPPFPQFWMEYGGISQATRIGVLCTEVSKSPWLLQMMLVAGNLKRRYADCLGSMTITLIENGSGTTVKEEPTPEGIRVWKSIDEAKKRNNALTGPFCFALLFMHCKNVARIEHVPPPKLAKRNLERGKPFMLKYQTLEIEPLKQILKTEGKIDSVGLERALHICRGHFAHYDESGKGLFGRGQFGDFWIPAHVRGTEKTGVVISDYSVQAPPEDEKGKAS